MVKADIRKYFANIYLNGFDHYLKDELGLKGYVRYVDDFVIFADSKAELWRLKSLAEDYLATHLRLRLHPKKVYVQPACQPLTFLGQRIARHNRRLR
ncbi:MAG: RNA-directed DNA polymerase, partial [Saprospiraceae bacterium]|nr:RNA-directed DNA polymerase [Saprospiraceae bacterium]